MNENFSIQILALPKKVPTSFFERIFPGGFFTLKTRDFSEISKN